MNSSKPFLVKNILEMNDDVSEEMVKETDNDNDKLAEEEVSEATEEDHKDPEGTAGSQFYRRKIRRCFRAEQLEYLERCFMEAIYPEASTRKRIAQELKVSNERVQVWFQNRRAKARKHWKQQYYSSTVPRIALQDAPKHQMPLEYHPRFGKPLPQFSQLHREFHVHRLNQRSYLATMLPFGGYRVQPPPVMPLCSCCPVPRSMANFKPYDPRMSQSPTPPAPSRCHCLPLCPRSNCML